MTEFHGFPNIESGIDLRGDQYSANRETWKSVLTNYQSNATWCASQGSAESQERHQSRGQLLARDRVSLILDPDSPFLELCPFAGFDIEDSSPCASLVTGIGTVAGRPCLVLAHIPTLSGGAWNEYTVLK